MGSFRHRRWLVLLPLLAACPSLEGLSGGAPDAAGLAADAAVAAETGTAETGARDADLIDGGARRCELVASSPTAVSTNLVVVEGWLVWGVGGTAANAENDGALYGMRTDTFSVQKLVGPVATPAALAAAWGDVYWTAVPLVPDVGNPTLQRVTLKPGVVGTPVRVTDPSNQPCAARYLEIDRQGAQLIYAQVNGNCGGNVFRVQVDGGGQKEVTTATDNGLIQALATDGERAYWTSLQPNSGGVTVFAAPITTGTVAVDAGAPKQLAVGQPGSSAKIVTDGSHIYFSTDTKIVRMPVSGGVAQEVFTLPSAGAATLAIDSRNLYIGASGTTSRVELPGLVGPATLLGGVAGPMVSDDNYLYVAASSGTQGAIWRCER